MSIAAYLNGLQPSRNRATTAKVAELGQQLYEQQCLEYHGPDGRGEEDGFVPSLRHQQPAYLVRELRAFASSHRANADRDFMQLIDQLDAPAMEALATYLAQMQGPVRDLTRFRCPVPATQRRGRSTSTTTHQLAEEHGYSSA